MRLRVEKYRVGEAVGWNTLIGCRVLTQPVFLPPIAWIPSPASWSKNIVTGKTYATDEAEGRLLWDRFAEAMALWPQAADAAPGPPDNNGPGPRFGEPVLVKPRLGQGAFRVSVMDAYRRECAISGGRVLPALEAAHIKPYAAGGKHAVTNGILLRRDIHSVFDAGYLTFDDDLRCVVSERVKTEFNNGNEYRRLHGLRLADPTAPGWTPDRGALAWHREAVFLG
jgi:putative restriction endonuclease